MTKARFSVEWLSQSSQTPSLGPLAAGGLGCAASGLNPPRAAAEPGPRGQRSRGVKGLESDSKGRDAGGCTAPGSAAESGRRECPSPEGPGGRGGRRLRTAFSVEQISTLESAFKRHKYLGSAERRKLAAKMRLSEVQIKTWFQNRRMKLKRQLQELRPEPFYSPGPYGALPLHCLYPAQQQLLAQLGRQEPGPASLAFPALPASALGSARQPGGFWPAPCFVGYRDPRAFLLPI